jgi:hypothetical protein
MKKSLLSIQLRAIVLVLCLFAGFSVKAQTWPWIYDGSILPNVATPVWTAADIGTAPYTIVNESGNSVLSETSTTAADKNSWKLNNFKQAKNATWLIRTKSGDKKTSLEFEINSKSGTTMNRVYFRLVNSLAGTGVLKTNYLNTNITFPLDSSFAVKSYHTYRITVENSTDFKIYLDENPAPIVSGTGAAGNTQTQFLRFGDIGSNWTEGTLDWMAWDTTAAYAPGTTLPAGVIVDNIPFPVAPAAPISIAATLIGQTAFTANWGASAGATSYFLDVATDAAFTSFVTGFNNRNVWGVNTYNITGLTAGSPYYYRVRAYNLGGASASSNAITANTLSIPAAPAAPVAIAATNVAQTILMANWNSSTDATKYYLDVATDAGFTNFVTGFNNLDVSNVTTYSVTGLTANTTYYYQVRANNSAGTSISSNAITVETLPDAPAAPVAAPATSPTKTSFIANWAASATATKYYLDITTDNTFTSIPANYSNIEVINANTYSVTGLTAATTYYYRVRAFNAGGTSANSNVITVLSAGTSISEAAVAPLKIWAKSTTVEIASNAVISDVKVTTISGTLITEKTINSTNASISTDKWNSGVYIVTVKTQKETIVKKISISK